MKPKDVLEVTGLFGLGVGGFLFGLVGIAAYVIACGAIVGLFIGSAVWIFSWVINL